MLSKVERCEASPTATVLGRIAAALELTLAELVSASVDDGPGRLRSADQSTWTDPATGYLRRQVFLSARLPLEMVEVFLPAGAAVAFPAASYILVRQVLWVLDGSVTVVEGERSTELAVGDRLEFGPPSDRTYRNDQDRPCRYLMVLIRR